MPTLFITGANRGIGLQLSKQFLEKDWNVIATCRNPKGADALNDLLKNYSHQLTIHALDVGDEDQIQCVKNELGDTPIDILFNNAGVYAGESAEFGNTNSKVWLDAFQINVISPMKIMEAFVNNVANSERKVIASMSSKMASLDDNYGSGGSYAYRATKVALNMAMLNVSKDVKPLGITALILHPGWVRTDMGGPNGELSAEESATALRNTMTNATMKDTGKFFDIDGSIIPW